MLNISNNSVSHLLPDQYRSTMKSDGLPKAHRMLRLWLLSVLFIVVVMMFMPWTQNIQAKGKVTTLDPSQRPQTIHATISGRIEKWYVREGQQVSKGDTIAFLSEVKTEYFDPALVDRTGEQVEAKAGAIGAYGDKAEALTDQIDAMQQELSLKRQQLARKVEQTELKLASLRAELQQAEVALEIAQAQFERTDTLFRRGIKSRTDLEDKRAKLQEARAKAVAAANKVGETENELRVAQLELSNITNEYNNKIAKTRADRSSTLSDLYTAQGDLNKAQVTYENYRQRAQYYYITAPQDAYITQVIRPGVGEIIKEGEALVSIMPARYELAVEMYVRPMDLPLIHLGNEVRFLFDGWPSIFFSGWPELSYGVYTGEIFAIDNTINKEGLYRILVAASDEGKPWPDALRPGSGARGIALLDRVPVWYELWRRLNAFPPNYYEANDESLGPVDAPKLKAPLKSVK